MESHSVREMTELMPRTNACANNTDSESTSVNPTAKTEYWKQVQSEMPSVILNFCEDIINNIVMHMPNYMILLLNVTFQFIEWIGLKKTIPMTQN